jgi:RimJ/RimL family protein N-acetyltransferase
VPEILSTDRLRVRPWTASDDDIAAAFAIYGDPLVLRYLFGKTPDASIDVTRDWLTRLVATADPTAPTGSWAIEERATGQVIGTLIFKVVEMNGVAEPEIGFHLARSAWGKGYATEASRALIAYGFATLDAPRIIGFAKPDNAASRRVLEKVGMHEDGTGTFKGDPVVVYAIEREALRTPTRIRRLPHVKPG